MEDVICVVDFAAVDMSMEEHDPGVKALENLGVVLEGEVVFNIERPDKHCDDNQIKDRVLIISAMMLVAYLLSLSCVLLSPVVSKNRNSTTLAELLGS